MTRKHRRYRKKSMRIAGLLLPVLVMALGLLEPAMAWADTPGTASGGSADSQTSGAAGTAGDSQAGRQGITLSIDSEHVYEGMGKAYQDGYTPTVAEGRVTLVLPLTADGDLKDDQLTASMDLGAGENSPFVYENFRKVFPLQEMQVTGAGSTRKIYDVRFELSLSPDRYNGTYPVTVLVEARDTAGNPFSQSFTIYVTVTDGKDPNEDGNDEPVVQEETPTSQPIVLVSGCGLDPATVKAGEEFTATVTLRNTSQTKAVQNMVVTVNYDSANFTLLEDSATIYIARLGQGASMELPLRFVSSLNIAEGSYPIELAMSYDNTDAEPLASSGTISIPVKQQLRVELTMPVIPGNVNAGDTLPLSFQVLNLGRSKIYNVRCEITGYGLQALDSAFVGDMEAGSKGEAAMNLFIGVLDQSEGYTGSDSYGKTEGKVTLYYEEADGTEYTEEFFFQTNINKPVVTASVREDQTDARPAGQWWISLGVCAVIVLLAVGTVFFRKRVKHETR